MARGLNKKEKLKGRSFALTIILGVFLAIMVSVLFNLIVDYTYPGPEYDKYCKGVYSSTYPIKYGDMGVSGVNCTFSKVLQVQSDNCTSEGGIAVYEYDNNGCTTSMKECSFCNKQFEEASKEYNRTVFFVFAVIGFILIVLGLYVSPLLVQIASIPSGAVLVIESAMRNFDDKLAVIIVFALLIVLAIVLALRKLR
jgi:hypothetical protein